MREGDVYGMHAFRSEDIDRARNGCWGRGHKNREASVVERFNNKSGHECLFDFRQRRLPDVFLTTSRYLLSQAPKQGIPWNFLEKRLFDPLPCRPPRRRTNSDTDEETDDQHEEKREDLFSGKPFREQLGKWPDKTAYCLHNLHYEQNGEVERYHYKQAANKRTHNELTDMFHM